jgi:hypothetical protein
VLGTCSVTSAPTGSDSLRVTALGEADQNTCVGGRGVQLVAESANASAFDT